MQFHGKLIAAVLAATGWLAVAGCGSGEPTEAPTTASIKGSPSQARQPGDHRPGPATNQPTTDPLHPRVIIDTSLGSITVELDKEEAPLTVANFLTYVESGHYDGTIFHQVLQDFPKLFIGGAYTKDSIEKNAHTTVRNEAHNGLMNLRGTIAMARRSDAIDSATCHFFINLADNDVLDHTDRTLTGYGYCVFGKVTEGLDVAEKIGAVEVHDTEKHERIPVQTVIVESIRRVP